MQPNLDAKETKAVLTEVERVTRESDFLLALKFA